ncbi:MAG: hypothetical protein QM730_27440 [Anaerolineales bacterium]
MRRMFRRQIRKTLAQEVPPVLQEANFTFDKGEYGRAAELYERIAQGADARGGPRAPILHLQAGRSRVYAGQTALGMTSLKRGLELFAQRGQWHKLQNMGSRVVSELKERGLTKEAAEIEAMLKGAAPSVPVVAETTPAKKPVLPTHCPSCGAPLRPDEVEWLDDVIAECGYCGSPVREDN